MIILQKHNLAYLAVPKTGSTSIEAVLDPFASSALRAPPGLKHANARRFEREIRPLFERPGKKKSLQTVAVIREPVDWLLSWYRYRGRKEISKSPNSTANMTFDSFVDAYLSDNRPAYANVGAQSHFVSDAAGRIIVNYIFQYEQLPDLVRFFEDRLKEKLTLPRLNRSPELEIEVGAQTRHKLEVALEADFDLHARLGTTPDI